VIFLVLNQQNQQLKPIETKSTVKVKLVSKPSLKFDLLFENNNNNNNNNLFDNKTIKSTVKVKEVLKQSNDINYLFGSSFFFIINNNNNNNKPIGTIKAIK